MNLQRALFGRTQHDLTRRAKVPEKLDREPIARWENEGGSCDEPDDAGRGIVTFDVRTKRVYDPADPSDGRRVLIDHVWPRGVTRERARLDEWARDMAPSDALREWFDHVPERFSEFRSRYREELASRPERLDDLRRRAQGGTLTIVFAARDREHNNAVVLAEVVRGA